MKRIFNEEGVRKGRHGPRFPERVIDLTGHSTEDGPGSSRGPSPRRLLSRVKGFVRYQQGGFIQDGFEAGPLNRTTREPRWVPGADVLPGRSDDPQAVLGRRAWE
jgi:hypothetical protein